MPGRRRRRGNVTVEPILAAQGAHPCQGRLTSLSVRFVVSHLCSAVRRKRAFGNAPFAVGRHARISTKAQLESHCAKEQGRQGRCLHARIHGAPRCRAGRMSPYFPVSRALPPMHPFTRSLIS